MLTANNSIKLSDIFSQQHQLLHNYVQLITFDKHCEHRHNVDNELYFSILTYSDVYVCT